MKLITQNDQFIATDTNDITLNFNEINDGITCSGWYLLQSTQGVLASTVSQNNYPAFDAYVFTQNFGQSPNVGDELQLNAGFDNWFELTDGNGSTWYLHIWSSHVEGVIAEYSFTNSDGVITSGDC